MVQPNDLLYVVGICMNCGSLAQRSKKSLKIPPV